MSADAERADSALHYLWIAVLWKYEVLIQIQFISNFFIIVDVK